VIKIQYMAAKGQLTRLEITTDKPSGSSLPAITMSSIEKDSAIAFEAL